MVSKDQTIGGLIFLICAVIAIVYLVTLFYPWWLEILGWEIVWQSGVQFWLVAIPVFIAFIAVLAIGAWIGWTMATTPPPKPIEEIEAEMETEVKEEKAEEEEKEKKKK